MTKSIKNRYFIQICSKDTPVAILELVSRCLKDRFGIKVSFEEAPVFQHLDPQNPKDERFEVKVE